MISTATAVKLSGLGLPSTDRTTVVVTASGLNARSGQREVPIFATLAQVWVSRALGRGYRGFTAALQYSGRVFSSAWGYLFSSESQGMRPLLGSVLVAASSALIPIVMRSPGRGACLNPGARRRRSPARAWSAGLAARLATRDKVSCGPSRRLMHAFRGGRDVRQLVGRAARPHHQFAAAVGALAGLSRRVLCRASAKRWVRLGRN
jgi:hypothetical protein